jgi:hypothetical protein
MFFDQKQHDVPLCRQRKSEKAGLWRNSLTAGLVDDGATGGSAGAGGIDDGVCLVVFDKRYE